MKVDDLVVGQSILVVNRVRIGFSRYKTFLVSEEIVKFTKTLVITKNERLKKDSFGHSFFANGVDTVARFGQVYRKTDQTKECKDFVRKMKALEGLIHKGIDVIDSLSIDALSIEEAEILENAGRIIKRLKN